MASTVEWYVDMIQRGKRTLEDVPEKDRQAVQKQLKPNVVSDAFKAWQERWKNSGLLKQQKKAKP